jgi:predicted aminopeptidase
MQAIRGQMDLMSRRRPVAEVISDEEAPDELKAKLEMLREARRFSIDELLLPDNDSYRSYADLERDYVVWNVFAAPEFSLEPRRWCFPVAGCVAYRGYFAQEAANKQAQKLKDKGYDVVVGGVPAYSTLGRFADPLLNTMMRWSDVDLVATLFHELAHQQLYIKDDTEFNESFATVVADIGIERWLGQRGEQDQLRDRENQRLERRAAMMLIETAKAALQRLYASNLDEVAMRTRKTEILEKLQADLASGSDNAFSGIMNNARLASLGLYEGRVDAFRAIFRRCKKQLPCFYEQTAGLADVSMDERNARLDALAETKSVAP